MPMREGLFIVVRTVGSIAQHPAHQTDICPANISTAVIFHLHQRFDIQVYFVIGDAVRQGWVEAV